MIREPSVASGVEFLSHPSVIPHSREEKISFLRGKGLTADEIEEAFKRIDARTGGTSAANPGAPGMAAVAQSGVPQPSAVVYQPVPQPPQEQWSLVSSLLAPLSLALSAGASALYFYKTYVLHEGNQFPWETGTPGLQPPPLFQEPLLTNGTTAQASVQQLPNGATGANPPPPQSWSSYPPGLPGLSSSQTMNGNAVSSLSPSATSNASTNEALKRTIDDQAQMIKDVMSTLKDVAATLKEKKADESPSTNGLNLQVVLQAMQASGEVKAELGAIKTLLLANMVRGSGVNNTSTLEGTAPGHGDISQLLTTLMSPEKSSNNALSAAIAGVSTPVAPATPELTPEEVEAKKKDEAMAKSREALSNMLNQCPPEQDDLLVSGCGLLLMYLKNIVKEPLNPRYRRVAKTNASFKKSLEPLAGHLEFFDAVGFTERGAQMELKSEWVESLEKDSNETPAWAKAILEDAITNLETVRDQRSPYAPAPPSTTTATAPVVAPKPLPKWEPPTSSPMSVPFTQPAARMQEPIQNPVPPPPTANSSSTGAPSYPLSFTEVAKMHAEGKRPDGIKDIPDKLSSDKPSEPTMAPPPKPWEKTIDTPEKFNGTPEASNTSFTGSRIYQMGGAKPKVEIVQLDENAADETGPNQEESGADQREM